MLNHYCYYYYSTHDNKSNYKEEEEEEGEDEDEEQEIVVEEEDEEEEEEYTSIQKAVTWTWQQGLFGYVQKINNNMCIKLADIYALAMILY